jgi:NAD+ synthase
MENINRFLDFNLINEKIISWIKTYCLENNISSLVVGVSGGIDSALVSTLCSKTGIKTYLALLPLNQKKEHTTMGENHINWLIDTFNNVEKINFDLSNIFDSFKKTVTDEYHNDLAFANTKSRLRMTMLYQIAQVKNGIVVGTGNKVEDFGVGFFTKYGDGGVDISPIADLYKSEVYSLARLNNISIEILNAKPTDGLWEDDRNDENQIGATYDELEWAMEYEKNMDDSKTLSDRENEVLKIYKNLNNKNKHKMNNIPIFKL